MTGDSAPRFLHIYCDESRQTADRYMVIGGIITAREYEPRFAEAMALYRQSQNMRAELKWTKVSDQKFTEYRALIDLFFSVNPLFHFKAIVVDTQEIDNRRYNKEELLDLALPLSQLSAEMKMPQVLRPCGLPW